MDIFAVRAFTDNYIWVLVRGTQAVVVDAGQAAPVVEFLQDKRLNLAAILITHHHHDHVGGVQELQKQYPQAQVFAHALHGVPAAQMVAEGDSFELLGHRFLVWQTAGHTDNHLSYLCQIDGVWRVFCGDTLFSGGCGRVFTGTIDALFDSLTRFNALPADTLFYAAHEYTLSNLRFALTLADDELKPVLQHAIADVQAQLAQGQSSLPTTLQRERQINVFLRTDDKALIANLQALYPQYRQQLTDPLSVFALLRALKNQA